MKDKHIFSKSYLERKEAVLNALRREEAEEKKNNTAFLSRTAFKALVSVAILSALTVSIYAAVQLIDFRMDKNGDEVLVHASLNGSEKDPEKPLRSWRAEDGEISVSLHIPDLPSDMRERENTNGKYYSDDASRAMTVNGIDLRRSDLEHLISGAAATEQFDTSGKALYIITKGEADFYNRIAYVVFEEDELVLKLWVSYGITDKELFALVSTMMPEYTTDALLAIPILNEVTDDLNIDIPFMYTKEDEPIYESDLLEIGESARDDNDWYTATVNAVEVYDNINVLNSDFILRKDFVEQFTDASGKLVPYDRTEVILTVEEDGTATKEFGETVTAKKKLYVVTLTMADVTMNDLSAADREDMLKACVNSFNLRAYTHENGEIKMQPSNAVVDRKPNAYADSSEIVYREYLGNDQWKVAYLIDENTAEGDLLLEQYTGKLYVKVK